MKVEVGSDTVAEPGIASGSKRNIYSFPVAQRQLLRKMPLSLVIDGDGAQCSYFTGNAWYFTTK